MTEITFNQNSSGYYVGTFEASGEETFVYVHRNSYGYLAIGSLDLVDTTKTCVDYQSGNEAPDKSFRTKYPAGSLVVVISKVPVVSAKTTSVAESDD